jgi:hypothetical protein
MDSAMAEFVDRDLHLVKKAVAIAILAIERRPGTFPVFFGPSGHEGFARSAYKVRY